MPQRLELVERPVIRAHLHLHDLNLEATIED